MFISGILLVLASLCSLPPILEATPSAFETTIFEEQRHEGKLAMEDPSTGNEVKCLDDLVLNTDPNDLWFLTTLYE